MATAYANRTADDAILRLTRREPLRHTTRINERPYKRRTGTPGGRRVGGSHPLLPDGGDAELSKARTSAAPCIPARRTRMLLTHGHRRFPRLRTRRSSSPPMNAAKKRRGTGWEQLGVRGELVYRPGHARRGEAAANSTPRSIDLRPRPRRICVPVGGVGGTTPESTPDAGVPFAGVGRIPRPLMRGGYSSNTIRRRPMAGTGTGGGLPGRR